MVLTVDTDGQVSVSIAIGRLVNLNSDAGVCHVYCRNRDIAVVVLSTASDWCDLELLSLLGHRNTRIPVVRAAIEGRRDCAEFPFQRIHDIVIKVVTKRDRRRWRGGDRSCSDKTGEHVSGYLLSGRIVKRRSQRRIIVVVKAPAPLHR